MKKKESKCCDCLSNFDFYKDLPRDLAEPTFIGATMSMGIMILMSVLFFYQVTEFMSY
jgi:hypothetical protein